MVKIDELLKQLTERGASDLHLKVGNKPIIRINGELELLEYPELSPDETLALAHSLMDARQHSRFEGINEIDFAYTAPGIGRFRVNVYRQRSSISIAMRHVVTQIPSFEELHLPELFKRLALEPRGLLLVTGTTGSGKTTTLAAMIDHMNSVARRHLITVEDPIEVLHRDKMGVINQREVGIDTDTYADALKYVLRQDPDVIFIGEMRDIETVRTALTAAQTGHFVLSTLHTINTTETVNRIIDFFPLHEQKQVRIMLAGSLRAIISQRLLPRADGGGRVPAIEVLVNTARIHDLILDADHTHEIQTAVAEGDFYGMQTFDQSLLDLYEEGLITLHDAYASATTPHDFKLAVQQRGYDISLLRS